MKIEWRNLSLHGNKIPDITLLLQYKAVNFIANLLLVVIFYINVSISNF